MPFNDGEQVGPYRVIEQLGRGGMATVYKAYHASLDRYVALKVLHPAFMEDPNFQARFQREAKVVAKLDHPNIIPIYDYAEHESRPYLVMKFVDGKTLKGRLKEEPLTPDEGVSIIEAVGTALSYAHKLGVLHRDVKPSNVIISDEGQVYLTDFGLARIASAGESTLSSDMMLGTPQYISPEQALGERDLDEGTDIYSFGVLIYELVVGQVPFMADTPFSIVHDHIYKPLPLPRAVNANVPEAVERVLLKALSKDRKDRYVDVASMVRAFKQAVKGEPLSEEMFAEAAAAQHERPPKAPTMMVDTPLTPEIEQAATPAPTPAPAEMHTPTDIRRKRRRRWWAIPIFLLMFMCVFILLASANGDNRGQTQITPTTGSVEQPADLSPIEAAQQAVDENPENAFLRLDLAAAYLDAGEVDLAETAFNDGLGLAGNDPEYSLIAGDMLSARGLWLRALEMYVDAVQKGYLPAEHPEIAEKIHQALYFAAEDRGFADLTGSRDVVLEPPLSQAALDAARARYTMFVLGQAAVAQTDINIVLGYAPDDPVATLVKAEIQIELGDRDWARSQLNILLERSGDEVESWVKLQARKLLSTLEN